jgi:DNA end-binding protein Ku
MPRAMWSGSITFGLVSVPVKMYPALLDRDIHFHLLSEDGRCRLRRKLHCPETGEDVDYRRTVRGYEVAPDQYVIVRDEELDALKPKASRAIEILDFVDLTDIDPVYYDRPYYLAPDQAGARGYRLLHQAMSDMKKVGIASFVMRRKGYLAAIRPIEHALCLDTMHFADEVVSVDELPGITTGEQAEPAKKELDVARKLIEALATKFRPDKYRAEYRELVREMVERKAAGEEIVTHAPAVEEAPRVVNLMKALEESLREARKTPATRRKKSA